MFVRALSEMARAVSAGQAGRYALLYAPDAVITIHGGETLTGRPAIEEYEVALLREFPGTRLAFYEVWLAGSRAAVHYGVRGATKTGQAMGHEGFLFYRLEPAGLIAEEHRYQDSFTPMAQLGALGPGPRRPLPSLPAAMKAHPALGSAAEAANVVRIKACLAALDTDDQEPFLASLGEGTVVEDLTEPAPVTGRRDIASWAKARAAAFTGVSCEVTTALGVGDFVLLECVVRGTFKGPRGRLSASDRPFSLHRAALAEVRNGKLNGLSLYWNVKELAQAVGQWPPA